MGNPWIYKPEQHNGPDTQARLQRNSGNNCIPCVNTKWALHELIFAYSGKPELLEKLVCFCERKNGSAISQMLSQNHTKAHKEKRGKVYVKFASQSVRQFDFLEQFSVPPFCRHVVDALIWLCFSHSTNALYSPGPPTYSQNTGYKEKFPVKKDGCSITYFYKVHIITYSCTRCTFAKEISQRRKGVTKEKKSSM